MKVRGPTETGSFQVLDELKLAAPVYEALERYVEDQTSGIDAQGVIQLALCYFLDDEARRAVAGRTTRRRQRR